MTSPPLDPAVRQDRILAFPTRIAALDRTEHAAFIEDSTHELLLGMLGNRPSKMPIEDIPEMMDVMLRHPTLWSAISRLSIAFMGAERRIPARPRQLAILRKLWLCGAPYAWGEHVKHGRIAGLTTVEIDRVTRGSADPGWDAFEAAVLRAAEELHHDAAISDATWTVLAESLDDLQLMELIIAIGQMTTVAYYHNAIRIKLEGDDIGLNAR